MCGRFNRTVPVKDVAAFFDLGDMPELAPRYNVAPTQDVLAVRHVEGLGRHGALLRWGLKPPWGDWKMVPTNARADTVATKPAFRSAFKRRRCLVPATGFYEWKAEGKKKQPHLFTVAGGLFAIAGLWEGDHDGATAETTCLITTEANAVVGPVHDRMPVILPREAWAAWLDPDTDTACLQALLRPFPPVEMTARQVSDYVNSSRNEGPRCVEPPTAAADNPAQASLF